MLSNHFLLHTGVRSRFMTIFDRRRGCKRDEQEKEVKRREHQELATAMQKVQEDLEKERKSDNARFHAMVRHGWTMAHRE